MKKILALTSLMFISTLALADAPSYTYIEGASFERTGTFDTESGDLMDFEGTGWGVLGSAEVTDNIFFTAGFDRGDYESDDIPNSEGDVFNIGLSAGYFSQLSNDTTWHTSAGFLRKKIELSYGNVENNNKDTAFVWNAGIRSNISSNIELNSNIVYTDHENDSVGLVVGAVYHSNSGLGISLNLGFNEDDRTLNAGVRYSF